MTDIQIISDIGQNIIETFFVVDHKCNLYT